MIGAFADGATFFIRDYDPEQNKDNVLASIYTCICVCVCAS